MMSYFFLTSTASVWIAILYMFLGLPLLLNPVASGTFFIWALAAGSAVYAVSHLVRYIQGRKEGLASGGDLFLTVVPLLFTVASLIWPQTLLAFLPLVLGALAAGRRSGQGSPDHWGHRAGQPGDDSPCHVLLLPGPAGHPADGQPLLGRSYRDPAVWNRADDHRGDRADHRRRFPPHGRSHLIRNQPSVKETFP